MSQVPIGGCRHEPPDNSCPNSRPANSSRHFSNLWMTVSPLTEAAIRRHWSSSSRSAGEGDEQSLEIGETTTEFRAPFVSLQARPAGVHLLLESRGDPEGAPLLPKQPLRRLKPG